MSSQWKSLSIGLVLLATTAMVPAVSVQSEASAISKESSGETAHMVTGELQRVDTTDQTFSIKDTNGEEVQFRYDSNTQVEGSSQGVQGLASKTGTLVTVHYEERSGQKVATKIEIKKK